MSDDSNWLNELIEPKRNLQPITTGVHSATAIASKSVYDRHPGAYDRLIGNRLYNRLIWGVSPAEYTRFAARAVASDAGGPLLDVGSGSAVFTAPAYRAATRPLVLVDSSISMLQRAHDRVSSATPAPTAFVRADLFDLPFRPHNFSTVSCHGLLHLFDDIEAVLRALRGQLAPGGRLYATSLVAETRVGRGWLALMHRSGEIAPPRTAADLTARAGSVLGEELHVIVVGSMAFLTAGTTSPR